MHEARSRLFERGEKVSRRLDVASPADGAGEILAEMQRLGQHDVFAALFYRLAEGEINELTPGSPVAEWIEA